MKKQFLLLLTFAIGSFSQAQPKDAIQSFNKYYEVSIEELRALYNIRGSYFKCEPVENPFESIKKFLEVYGDNKEKIGVIFYSLDSSHLRTWLIRNDQLYFSQQVASKQTLKTIEKNIRDALQVDMLLATEDVTQRGLILKDSSRNKTDLQAAIREATAVLLPPPIAENLPGLSHLILITEYNIGQIPFYILKPYKNNAYLVDSVSLSLAPHLCNLGNIAAMNRLEMGVPNKLFAENPLIVGNPAYVNTANLSFPRLPGAASEAAIISEWTNGTLLTDSAATISTVKKLSRQADLLYFATHGYSDFEKVLDGSYLAFAPDDSSATGLWTARQIQEENFSRLHMMAVLSACQTGVGKVYDAGFIGLGRAFFKAGVDHTIMSLWSVNDKATKDLMSMFFQHMIKTPMNFYPASHLRAAILQFKKKQENPALWAPFILFGFPY
jgi:CHAT domain-containing protein